MFLDGGIRLSGRFAKQFFAKDLISFVSHFLCNCKTFKSNLMSYETFPDRKRREVDEL